MGSQMIHDIFPDYFLDFLHLLYVEGTIFGVGAGGSDGVTMFELFIPEKQMGKLLRNLVSLVLGAVVEEWHSPLGVSQNVVDAGSWGWQPVYLRLDKGRLRIMLKGWPNHTATCS